MHVCEYCFLTVDVYEGLVVDHGGCDGVLCLGSGAPACSDCCSL